MKNISIASVDRALEVLNLLHETEREMGVSEISRELNLSKSTVYRTLFTLEKRGYVSKNQYTEKYWLGLKLYAMGMTVKDKTDYLDQIIIETKKLYDEFREVVNVSVLEHTDDGFFKSVIVHKESNPDKVLSVNATLGAYTDAHVSAVGKCLMAFSKQVDEEYIKGLNLKRYTKNTITDNQKLLEELLKIRECGYAVDNEEREIGLLCIGVPIFDIYGNAVAAMSISGPISRMQEFDKKTLVSKLIESSRRIKVI